MSAPVQQADEDAGPTTPSKRHRSKRRRRITVTTAAAIVVIGGIGGGYYYVKNLHHNTTTTAAANPDAVGLHTITTETLSEQTTATGTLGYAGNYTVLVPSDTSASSGSSGGHSSGVPASSGAGTFTWLPADGQTVSQGQPVYAVGDAPVVLLYGPVPVYRTLSEGMTGNDVEQLNQDLVALGDVGRADISALGWDYFSWETRVAVAKLQSELGIAIPPGWLGLGQVVFEPGALRVKTVTASLGSPASGPVLRATSDRHVVTIALDASEQSYVKTGDKVTVTLPDGKTIAGVVSGIGTVVTSASSPPGYSSSSSSATIPVYVRLTHLKAAGSLDQAPVTVNITTDTAKNVLAVPVTALLARAGGYAVEVVGPGNTRRLVPVRVGPVFDDASGLVQVSGTRLAAGQHVVVPAL